MKHIHRFFVQGSLTTGGCVQLGEDDAFHAARVLRLGQGDSIELADPEGRVFEAEISGTGSKGDSVEALVGAELTPQKLSTVNLSDLTVVQALPKGRKLDLIAEKLSEIGVARLVPVFSDRSVARPEAGRDAKVDRWRRVARAAAAQSKRSRVMVIDEPAQLEDWLRGFEGGLLVLATEIVGSPLGEAVSVYYKSAVESGRDPGTNGGISLIVGPEAGFSGGELERFASRGAGFVSLGPLVLRTETAAIVAATVVMHRLGVIG